MSDSLADAKANGARVYEKAYYVGHVAGRITRIYVLPTALTFFAVKYGVRSGMKGLLK